METPVLVTGAAGFIGSHTVDQLLSEGVPVIGVDDLSTGRLANLEGASKNPAFRLIEADITEGDVFLDLCLEHRPGAIIHLAGLVSVIRADEEPDENFRLNILATHIVAEAARKAEIKRIVFASSAATYGENANLPLSESEGPSAINLYGNAKAISEQILLGHAHTYDSTAICFRYFNVYGPRQDPKSPYSGVISIFADRMSRNEPVTIFGDGEQSRDFVSVRDLARANALAAVAPGLQSMSCNLCTGKQQTLNELVAVFQEIFPEAPEPQHVAARPGEIIHSCGDPERAKETLQFQPRVSLAEGLRELVS